MVKEKKKKLALLCLILSSIYRTRSKLISSAKEVAPVLSSLASISSFLTLANSSSEAVRLDLSNHHIFHSPIFKMIFLSRSPFLISDFLIKLHIHKNVT